jgi:hypothetical protein
MVAVRWDVATYGNCPVPAESSFPDPAAVLQHLTIGTTRFSAERSVNVLVARFDEEERRFGCPDSPK